MAHYKEFMPRTMLGKIYLAQNWLSVLNREADPESGGTGTKAELWGIPAGVVSRLKADYAAAREAKVLAESPQYATKVAATRCREAVRALEKTMRMIKNFYFRMPPLGLLDFISLGLKPPAARRGRRSVSKDVLYGIVYNPLPGLISLLITPQDKAAEKGDGKDFVLLRYGILFPEGRGPGKGVRLENLISSPPELTEDLPGVKLVPGKKINLDLGRAYSGADFYFSLAYINNRGETGIFCPIEKAVIS